MSEQAFVLPVWDTINTAWTKVSGTKKTFWAAIGILAAIMFGIGLLEGITEKAWAISGFLQIIGNVLGYFLQLGLVYIGITRAKDMPINYKMLFATFDLQIALRLVGLYILQTLIFLIPVIIGALGIMLYMTDNIAMQGFGVILIIASGICTIIIAVRLSISIAYVLDADEAPLAAIKKSLAATNGNVWHLIGIYLLQLLILGISVIPAGIGLIWSLPFLLICYGMIYKQLRVNT